MIKEDFGQCLNGITIHKMRHTLHGYTIHTVKVKSLSYKRPSIFKLKLGNNKLNFKKRISQNNDQVNLFR